MSLPAWGVWIEIDLFFCPNQWLWSLPAWGVWIEIENAPKFAASTKVSLPAWGVWIEIRKKRQNIR